MPADMIMRTDSSVDQFTSVRSARFSTCRKPVVGLGVVGMKTVASSSPVTLSLNVDVTKPTARSRASGNGISAARWKLVACVPDSEPRICLIPR